MSDEQRIVTVIPLFAPPLQAPREFVWMDDARTVQTRPLSREIPQIRDFVTTTCADPRAL